MGPMPVMPSGECPREFPGQEERNLLTQEEKDIFMLGCSKDYPAGGDEGVGQRVG
jgi:hypothetical protein